MEWGHRVLGRVIGITFIVPLLYFRLRKKLNPSMHLRLTGMTLLIAAQGALGWYMVKSGLEDSIMDTPGAVPRVSQYRLAAHLGTAVVLYAGMLGTGLTVIKDWKYANGRPWSGSSVMNWQDVLSNPVVKRFSRLSKGLTALVFLTALSGSFPSTFTYVRLKSLCRRVCCWFGCRTAIQRVSADGGSTCTSYE